MDIFQKIHLHGFRRHLDVEIDLKPLNVMIGANGGGKTSLLDACTLLAASAVGNFNAVFSDMGGMEANLTVPSQNDPRTDRRIGFSLVQSVENFAPLHYNLTIQPRGASYEIRSESLLQFNRGPEHQPMKHIETMNGRVKYFDPRTNSLETPDWEFPPGESALSQVPRMYRSPEEFRKKLASSTHYHVLDVSPQARVRRPQSMKEAHLPGREGEDLISCLYWMREAAPDRFEVVEDTLRAGFPKFEGLKFPPVANGFLSLTWKERGMSRPFGLHQLSEGTLRFLWLTTLLYSPGLTGVTMIDEPEVSLHPELLSLLAESLREASTRTQLIIATHADRLVRFLRPEEVVVLDSEEDGMATATRADRLNLGAWLEDYSMDQLWQNGTMGGRP